MPAEENASAMVDNLSGSLALGTTGSGGGGGGAGSFMLNAILRSPGLKRMIAEFVLASHLNFSLPAAAWRVFHFRDVAQAFNPFRQLDENSKSDLPGNFAVNHVTYVYLSKEILPRVLFQLFQPQSQPPIRGVQGQDGSINLLTLLQNLRGMLDVAIPRHVA